MKKPPNSIWNTQELNEILKSMWGTYTARNIAEHLNQKGYRVTRNAIIGRARRLGLPTPVRQDQGNPNQVQPRRQAICRNRGALDIVRVRPIKRSPKMPSAKSPKGDKAVPMLLSQEGQCKAIIDYENNEKAKAIYCGEDAVVTISHGQIKFGPWCHYHKKRYVAEMKK